MPFQSFNQPKIASRLKILRKIFVYHSEAVQAGQLKAPIAEWAEMDGQRQLASSWLFG
jgi:hypothetical protein